MLLPRLDFEFSMGSSESKESNIAIQSDSIVGNTSSRYHGAWKLALSKISSQPIKNECKVRTGWKTVRIFVSSTFKDFNAEREVLVKKIFPDLRAWCQERQLNLIDIDLRWGVPADASTEEKLRQCLEEIDRCYDENVVPFFINLTSDRCGWVPESDQLPAPLKDQYKWIDGMSVTEMEILHGAFRIQNQNGKRCNCWRLYFIFYFFSSFYG